MKLILAALALAVSVMAQPLDLSGEWRFHAGDSPAWAQPAFDDSAWATVRLPRSGSRAPGWNWYRKTLSAPAIHGDTGLTLGIVALSYEVFVNGKRIGEAGHVGAASQPFNAPHWFLISEALAASEQPFTIALRVWNPGLAWMVAMELPDSGPYLLTTPWHAGDAAAAARLRVSTAMTPTGILGVTQILLGLFTLSFWLAIARREELLWLGGYLFFIGIYNTGAYLSTTTALPLLPIAQVAGYVCLTAASAWIFPSGRSSGRMSGLMWSLMGLVATATFAGLPIPVLTLAPAWWALRALFGRDREQRWFAMPVLLYELALLNMVMRRFLPEWPVNSFTMAGIYVIAHPVLVSTLGAMALIVLLIRRTGRDQQEKSRLAGELDAARSVQQLLLPQGARHGEYEVEAAYLPATEVGGDFYSVLPSEDGVLTIIAGDVSGKGLKAAMVVSMLAGVARERAGLRPAPMLAALNRAITGSMAGGFVTCCVVRLEADGAAWFANAGHLPPYVANRELECEGGLPLGIVDYQEYTESGFRLAVGEAMTLISDGVVEAANSKGELFGFDRTRDISRKSARDIAEAAKAWGQNDDITVVMVRRAPC